MGTASKVPFDVNMTAEVRAFLDDLDRTSIHSGSTSYLKITDPNTDDDTASGTTAGRLDIFQGSAANPVTGNDTPTVSIARYEEITTTLFPHSAALLVNTQTTAATTQQANVVVAYGTQKGSADAVGFFTVVGYEGAASKAAFGAYLEARANSATAAAICAELRCANNSGSNGTYSPTVGANHFIGTDYTTSGNNCSVAIQIRGVKWDVGIGFQTGDFIGTAAISDDSQSPTILKASNTHTNGIDLSGGTFTGSQIKFAMGTNLTNAVNDAAAAGAGVPVGGVYRNGSVLMVRVA